MRVMAITNFQHLQYDFYSRLSNAPSKTLKIDNQILSHGHQISSQQNGNSGYGAKQDITSNLCSITRMPPAAAISNVEPALQFTKLLV